MLDMIYERGSDNKPINYLLELLCGIQSALRQGHMLEQSLV